MDLIDHLQSLANRIKTKRDVIKTEEAAKTAFVLPFIQALGYDVFDPTEVTPELSSSVGTKATDRVDYAILKDGEPIILIECKKCGADLDAANVSQLLRYFHGTKAQFSILTDGIIYKFYTDLENKNVMDLSPFLTVNLLDFNEETAQELKRFTKTEFDVKIIQQTSKQLKYINHIKKTLVEWMDNPSEDFVKLVCSGLMADNKKFTTKLVSEYTEFVSRAFNQVINDKIGERLKLAMNPATPAAKEDAQPVESPASATPENSNESQFSALEVEALHIIKSILRTKVAPSRVSMRPRKSSNAILLDESQKKTICRISAAAEDEMFIILIKPDGEVKEALPSLDAIYAHSDQLIQVAESHIQPQQAKP